MRDRTMAVMMVEMPSCGPAALSVGTQKVHNTQTLALLGTTRFGWPACQDQTWRNLQFSADAGVSCSWRSITLQRLLLRHELVA